MSDKHSTQSMQAADALKRNEQDRSFSAERFIAAHKLYAEQCHAERLKSFDAVVMWGANVVRTLFLLNGGAILAFITFTGSLFGKGGGEAFSYGIEFAQSLLPAFYCFIAGICLAAVISGISYLNFTAGFHIKPLPDQAYALLEGRGLKEPPSFAMKLENLTFITAIVCAVSALICFIVGCYFVQRALLLLQA